MALIVSTFANKIKGAISVSITSAPSSMVAICINTLFTSRALAVTIILTAHSWIHTLPAIAVGADCILTITVSTA